MLCQNCGKYEATTHIKRIINGQATEAHLCPECAGTLGYANAFSDFGFNFADMLSSFFNENTVGVLSNNVLRCEKCGSSFNDIVKSGKIGCSDCYRTFYDKLLPSLERIHGRTHHEGKIANTGEINVIENKLTALKSELQNAVIEQNYELAAKLRDEIKELESGETGDE